jgi:two-component system, OmpR family, response regulator VicR
MNHFTLDHPVHRQPVPTGYEPLTPTANRLPALAADSAVAVSTQVLVVEDDPALLRLLILVLKKEGFGVFGAASGEEALRLFGNHSFHLVLLDIDMPTLNGFTVCAELRKRTHIPIVFVTAKSRIDDLLRGFELGGDSYITKPFTMQELRARVRALLRRTRAQQAQAAAQMITIGEISLNEETQEVIVRGQPVSLTPNEYRLLDYLMRHPDQMITKKEFLAAVWQYESTDDVNFMRVTVRRLRNKIELDPANPHYIKTVHGVGYQLCSAALLGH